MINGVISKIDTTRLLLILAAFPMLRAQQEYFQEQLDITVIAFTKKVCEQKLGELQKTIDELIEEYDTILLQYGIKRYRKSA